MVKAGVERVRRWLQRNEGSVIAVGVALLCLLVVGAMVAPEAMSSRLMVGAQVVGSASAAVAAVAAWRTAARTETQSRDTARALARATRPDLEIGLFERERGDESGATDLCFGINNYSRFAVSGGRIEWTLSDGETGRTVLPALLGKRNEKDRQLSAFIQSSKPKWHHVVALGNLPEKVTETDHVTLSYWSEFSNGEWVLDTKWSHGDHRLVSGSWNWVASWERG